MDSARRNPDRLPHVLEIRRGDSTWLYYRRGGRRWPLPGPEGSARHIAEHQRIHAAYGRLRAETPAGPPGTVEAAIRLYLGSADFRALAPASQRAYRATLDRFRTAFGPLLLADLGLRWWDELRDLYTRQPIAWNALRSRMRDVIALYRRRHPELVPANPLHEIRRMEVAQSDQNRAWPAEVLGQVMAAATPQFRALLVGYLLTVQRGGDVTAWRREQYDPAARTITMRQEKTALPLVLHVPAPLAAIIEAQPVRHPERLFCSPRGRAWTLANAQETLARLLRQLGLERYTLHGLRATGPTALARRGRPNRQGRSLTGHGSDRSYEIYTRGAADFPMRQEAQDLLAEIFAPALASAELGGNTRRFTGTTGRAARSRLQTEVQTANREAPANRRKPAEK